MCKMHALDALRLKSRVDDAAFFEVSVPFEYMFASFGFTSDACVRIH